MRMLFDGFIGRTASMGSPGVNEMRCEVPTLVVEGDKVAANIRVFFRKNINQRMQTAATCQPDAASPPNRDLRPSSSSR